MFFTGFINKTNESFDPAYPLDFIEKHHRKWTYEVSTSFKKTDGSAEKTSRRWW